VDDVQISVVIPTLNEAENLPELMDRLQASLRRRRYEVLIVDDGSVDGTVAVCAALAMRHPLRLLRRTGAEDGLAGAVIAAFQRARGKYLVVMDGDLQHPPEAIGAMLIPLEHEQADFVIGCRHLAGASIDAAWPVRRRIASRLARWLARPIAGPLRDPMSGFFAIRQSVYASARALAPVGYKIALELLCKRAFGRVCEVPIHFGTRRHGTSKLSLGQSVSFLRHLARLYAWRYFGFRVAPTPSGRVVEVAHGDFQTARRAA